MKITIEPSDNEDIERYNIISNLLKQNLYLMGFCSENIFFKKSGHKNENN